MIEIGRRPTLVEDPHAAGAPNRRREDQDHRTGRNHTSLGDSTLTGEFGHDLGGERGHAFATRLHRALGQSDDANDPMPQPADALRVLAVAGLAAALQTNTIIDAPTDPAPHVAAMVERIEKAVSAQNIAALPGAVSLKLDVSDLNSSIAGIAITLSRDSIDLVLTPTTGQPDALWASAAQDLANRLHQRFPRRIVRVLEDQPAPDRPQGLAAFTRLLDPAGDRS